MASSAPDHLRTPGLISNRPCYEGIKVARALEEAESPKRGSGQPSPYAVRKEGAGQAVLIGLPNSGKSQLLTSLTGASAKVADYPYTTRIPLPGMLSYENVLIQLVDTPAISDQEVQARLFSMLRNTDLLLMVVDLSDDPLRQAEEIISELNRYGFQLLRQGEEADSEDYRVSMRCLMVANKADAESADIAFEFLEELYGAQFPILRVSAATGTGLDELALSVYAALNKVRVYLKSRGTQPDYAEPLVLDQGSVIQDAALSVHKDWTRKIKYALLWGSGKFDGQRVGRDYVLEDGDVIELHD